ncbi:MAG: archease [Thermodesulfovibrionales bacterium]|nr:archease [Thermodesulfovibrionales bacterium]
MTFEVLDISGDAGIRAYGKRCEDAFMNTGLGMYSLMTDIDGVLESQEKDVEVRSDSAEGLLVGFLNELIFQFDTYGFIGRRMEVTAFSIQPSAYIKAKVYGEEFEIGRHEQRLLVKAATYHNIKVERINDEWKAEVIFDI